MARKLNQDQKDFIVHLMQTGTDQDLIDHGVPGEYLVDRANHHSMIYSALEINELKKMQLMDEKKKIKEIPEGCIECTCGGSGLYFGKGYVLNGVFQGYVGTCYRCGGKGYQTKADVKRNNYYDNRIRCFH